MPGFITLVSKGISHVTFVSQGWSGEDWVSHFALQNAVIEKELKRFLLSKHFKPSERGTSHHIAILAGTLFEDNKRTTSRIIQDASGRKMGRPTPEVGCFIFDLCLNGGARNLGLRQIITMCKMTYSFRGYGCRPNSKTPKFRTGPTLVDGRPGCKWPSDTGFAFNAPS